MHYFCGVDIGASAAKLVIVDEKREVVASAIRRSGVNYEAAAEDCLREALSQSGLTRDRITRSRSTGYGRANVSWVDGTKTEIACHGKGAFFHVPQAITVIDIGAQDNKVIHLGDDGRRLSFKMNRKCAAGTGSFLEEIALRLALSISELNDLAGRSQKEVSLGSFCTVFAATEILGKIRAGERVEDIVKGAFRSVAQRVLEMDNVSGTLVLTGGVVAHNPLLATIVEESFGKRVLVPPHPQHIGAFGAALYALENLEEG